MLCPRSTCSTCAVRCAMFVAADAVLFSIPSAACSFLCLLPVCLLHALRSPLRLSPLHPLCSSFTTASPLLFFPVRCFSMFFWLAFVVPNSLPSLSFPLRSYLRSFCSALPLFSFCFRFITSFCCSPSSFRLSLPLPASFLLH